MKTQVKQAAFHNSPEEVFDQLDDLGITGMHMTESSMPLMGGKMNLEYLTPEHKGLHTRYRWTGAVLWWKLDFTVQVTKWLRGREKVWETIGEPKLIIYSWFQMNLSLNKVEDGSIATLSISYEKPKKFFEKVICFFLGAWYANWCLKNMLRDAGRILKEQAIHPRQTQKPQISS